MRRPLSLQRWDEPGCKPVSAIPDIQGLDAENQVRRVTIWFLQNFADPAKSGAEKVNLYVRGGPYKARDILDTVFGGDAASAGVVREAEIALSAEGFLWAPHLSRHLSSEEATDLPPLEDGAAFQAMRSRIARLEMRLAELERGLASIGHNNPPEPIDQPPLSEEERKEVTAALAVLKSQPATPADGGKPASEATSTVQSRAEKIREWLARRRENIATAAVTTAVGEGIKAVPIRALWEATLRALDDLIAAVVKWLMM